MPTIKNEEMKRVKPGQFERDMLKLNEERYSEGSYWDSRGNKSPKFTKHDDGKLQWSSFCWKAAAKVMRVMHHGADKYGWDNWRKAQTEEDRRRYLDAAFRHMIAYAEGEVYDKDSLNPHLWHAACSLLFFLEYDDATGRENPDEDMSSFGAIPHSASCPVEFLDTPIDEIVCRACREETKRCRKRDNCCKYCGSLLSCGVCYTCT